MKPTNLYLEKLDSISFSDKKVITETEASIPIDNGDPLELIKGRIEHKIAWARKMLGSKILNSKSSE